MPPATTTLQFPTPLAHVLAPLASRRGGLSARALIREAAGLPPEP